MMELKHEIEVYRSGLGVARECMRSGGQTASRQSVLIPLQTLILFLKLKT